MSKSACNVERPCERCQRLGLNCITSRMLSSTSYNESSNSSTSSIVVSFPAFDDTLGLNRGDPVFYDPRNLMSTLVTSMDWESQKYYSALAIYTQFIHNIDYYSPFSLAEFIGKSSTLMFTSWLAIVCFYLPIKMATSIVQKIADCSADFIQDRSIASGRVSEPYQSLQLFSTWDHPFSLPSQLPTGTFQAHSLQVEDIKHYLNNYPFFSIFPLSFLKGRQIAVIYLAHPTTTSESLGIEPYMNDYAETILEYTSQELAELCASRYLWKVSEDLCVASPFLQYIYIHLSFVCV